ncbi:hypothetical protein FPSE_12208 [Fusarium pseudograminearum CS3096]|uniref:Uncharacterized protein n=1 Tax=Fusarium pseudograminearum (strain CS3096) TaxID=1028729 RepID=K3V3L7_FUSPC|nr:hypothetical protein FPSE_12208 [Fusarium pseudograminearum CS3096]EKJ67627.1 hypothetical protein FPSE_12208 [Fusarium pseudograminearum CS3096]
MSLSASCIAAHPPEGASDFSLVLLDVSGIAIGMTRYYDSFLPGKLIDIYSVMQRER